MKNGVDVYGGGKLELIRTFAHFLDNWKQSIEFVVQFLCGPVGADIPSIEPDHIPGMIYRSG
jgi:hypothetical protein